MSCGLFQVDSAVDLGVAQLFPSTRWPPPGQFGRLDLGRGRRQCHRSTDPPIHRSTDFSKRKYLEMIDLPSVGSRRRERPFFLIFPAADWSLYCALYHRRRQRPRTWPRILQLEFDIFSGFSFLFFSFLFFLHNRHG